MSSSSEDSDDDDDNEDCGVKHFEWKMSSSSGEESEEEEREEDYCGRCVFDTNVRLYNHTFQCCMCGGYKEEQHYLCDDCTRHYKMLDKFSVRCEDCLSR